MISNRSICFLPAFLRFSCVRLLVPWRWYGFHVYAVMMQRVRIPVSALNWACGVGRAPSVPVVSQSFPVDPPAIPGSGPARQAGSLRFPSVVRRSAPDAWIGTILHTILPAPESFCGRFEPNRRLRRHGCPPPCFNSLKAVVIFDCCQQSGPGCS